MVLRSFVNYVVSSKWALNMCFVDLAQRAFSFLLGAEFRLVNSDTTRVRYESNKVSVTIEWEVRSGELNAFIGLQSEVGEVGSVFSLSDILAMEKQDVPGRKMPFQVSEEDRLGPFLEMMAEDMQLHAQRALTGDRMFFRRLDAFRNAQSDAYMCDMELRRVRAEADIAWQQHDFNKLVVLYTLIESRLSTSEKAKLTYAKKHRPNYQEP
jgi:hypothetical protein